MDAIVVVGMGRFGTKLARNLTAAGREVIAVDSRRDLVEIIASDVTHAVALDVTDEAAVRSQNLHQAGTAVIAIGLDFEAIVLATVMFKQLGVARVISRAPSQIAADVLRRVGADAVVMPENESADRWTNRLIGPEVLNHIEFHEGQSISEVRLPKKWVGKSLADLQVRNRYGLHVVAVRRTAKPAPADPDSAPKADVGLHASRVEVPNPTDPLLDGDVLILMGRDEDLSKLPEAQGG